MLSVAECREHLGRKDYTDEQIINLRDTLYVFVENLVDEYVDNSVTITKSCKKQLFTAEFPPPDKKVKAMG